MNSPVDSPLSFGQRYHWWNHHLLAPSARHVLNIVIRWVPPPDATMQSLQLAVDHLVRENEGLRTTFHCEGPVQRVHSSASVPITRIELIGDEAGATALRADIERQGFDLARERPIRVAVFTENAKPSLMIIVVHHIAVDDWSVDLLRNALRYAHDSVAGRRVTRPQRTVEQPSGLARLEESDMAVPHGWSRSALAYWERELAASPADLFASRRRTPMASEPMAHSASLSSPEALAAARDLAIRYMVWPANVYIAAFAVTLRGYTGQDWVPCQIFCANRVKHKYTVASLFLPSLIHVDCGGTPKFSDVVRRTAESAREALVHSRFPYDEALERVVTRGSHKDDAIRLGPIFNFLNRSKSDSGVKRSVFMRNSPPVDWAQLGDDIYFRLYQWQDCAVAVLDALASVMSADDIRAFLRGFESVLVKQAAAPSEMTLAEFHLEEAFDSTFCVDRSATGFSGEGDRNMKSPPAAEAALIAAFEQANGRRPATLRQCYVDAGGKLLHAPRTLELLAHDGWSGLQLQTLASPVTLALAAKDMSSRAPVNGHR